VTHDDGRAAAFAAIAVELQADRDTSLTSLAIVERLADLVPDADEVSLTIRGSTGHTTLASTGDLALEADRLQYAHHEGPCIAAADGTTWFRSGDVGDDPRWPTWGPAAAALGVGSLLAVPLVDGDEASGALNLYSRHCDRFAEADTIEVAVVYGIHAANALTSARLVTNLHTALSSRHVIGMAQGIIMQRYGLNEEQSFELLHRLSSSGDRKLRDVAAYILEHRELPG
jgi:GAF domain-containing protein